MQNSLEKIYKTHNSERRGDYFVLHGTERGSFLIRNVGSGKRILDIGCRDGALTKYYAEGNEVIGADIDNSALERAQKLIPGIRTINADLNGDWPFAGGFDAVVACEVIEHLYYPNEVLNKIYTQLKPGGSLVGSIPNAFSMQTRLRFLFGTKKNTALADPTHINHFSEPEFRRLLESAGFVNIKIETITSRKFKVFSWLFPYLFAFDLLFVGFKPK